MKELRRETCTGWFVECRVGVLFGLVFDISFRVQGLGLRL